MTAAYSDDKTKDVIDQAAWEIKPIDALKITGSVLAALKDTNTSIKAILDSAVSDSVNLNVYWEVNGHRLPPEPDPKVNNATLLGIDVNDNGVRDDVERWIYETYKDKHPIHIDIAMQGAGQNRIC